MQYELEFIGINEETTNADAICFRFFDPRLGRYVVGIYDGGTKVYGEAVCNHIRNFYFQNEEECLIDFVICSHSDQDHASGLEIVLSELKVNALVINIPWLYVDELFEKVNDGRITPASLRERLKESYPYVAKLEELATEKGVNIYSGFEGCKIFDYLTVLSPSRGHYINMLVESTKTPLKETTLSRIFAGLQEYVANITENWFADSLREDVETSSENETSIIIHGDMQNEKFLLTGDAGIVALRGALDYSSQNEMELSELKVIQIPHHGGRHNLSPSIMNELLGPIMPEGYNSGKYGIVSVAKESKHPKKMVTNAFLRRGATVYEARAETLRHSDGIGERVGWRSAPALTFHNVVEAWED